MTVFYPKNHTTTLSIFTGERERAEDEEGEATATSTQHRCVQACPRSKREKAGFFEPSPSTLTPSLPLQLATNPSSPNDDPASVHIHAGAFFAHLKALNRDANVAARAHKQITADARQDMDQTHLRLQNPLYESHLEREIEKCRQFAHVCPLFGSHLLRCSYPVFLSGGSAHK
jgi:hypothetical protein